MIAGAKYARTSVGMSQGADEWAAKAIMCSTTTEKALQPGKNATNTAHSLALLAQIPTYDDIVRRSVSSAGSMMPTSIDPHALHLKL